MDVGELIAVKGLCDYYDSSQSGKNQHASRPVLGEELQGFAEAVWGSSSSEMRPN